MTQQANLYGALIMYGYLGSIFLGSTFLLDALFRIWWAGPPLLVGWIIWATPQGHFAESLPGVAITLGATYLLWRWGRAPQPLRITSAAQWVCWGVAAVSVLLWIVSLLGGVYWAKTRHYTSAVPAPPGAESNIGSLTTTPEAKHTWISRPFPT